jgi:putative nucleotidyltransferase-like protein
LCACSGVELPPERVDRIAGCNASGIDWEVLLRRGEHHGVLPLLERNLRMYGRNVPASVQQSLQASLETNVRRNLWFASELVRILQIFEEKKIHTVPYKGPVLAESVYGDVALRSFGDLDFLVAAQDFTSARAALEELGYQPSVALTEAAERMLLTTGYELSFDSAAGKYLVEMQWRLLPHFYAVDLRVDDLLSRSERAVVGGRNVPSLSPEDLLLVLCLHAAKHLWMRLIWVCDIAETLRSQALDYEVLFSRTRELGVVRVLGVSFWLAKNVLGAAIPQPAEDLVASDAQVEILGKQFAQRLASDATYDFESTEYYRLVLDLRERREDRIRYLWRLVWTPGPGEVAAVQLPQALSPLYRAVRVLRLMKKMA